VLGVALLLSCASRQAEKSLDPESQEFLSKSRYIISKDERRIFLSLADEAERKVFMENFWKKRDPDPETEKNEFKIEYYKRMNEANLLFKEGTTPGWLCERGRLYITLGPPDNRETYPRGVTFYGKPTEIWYYGFFPVVFIDDNWSGNYILDPSSAAQIGEINKTQVMLRPRVSPDQAAESIPLDIQEGKEGETLVQLKLPYKDIWLTAEGDLLKTTLELSVEVFDSTGKIAWQDQKSYPLAFSRAEYMKIIRDTLVINIPIRLRPGDYDLKLILKNFLQGADVQKKTKLHRGEIS
jgi:GWxTD domain-containing protein